jgi:hypothetical protein
LTYKTQNAEMPKQGGFLPGTCRSETPNSLQASQRIDSINILIWSLGVVQKAALRCITMPD